MLKNIEWQAMAVYIILFVTAILTVQQIWFIDLFDRANFLNWDAEHYHEIMENGYHGYRVAFFPLFPMVWRLLSGSVLGAVCVNAIVFLLSFYLLIRRLNIKRAEEILLYLSIPSFIFFYLPYSEAIFFLCGVLILLGLKENRQYFVYAGLLFAILCRPAFTIFIPALVITELLSEQAGKKYQRIGVYLLITLVGILLVGIVQFVDTGEWFNFFSAQKRWGNELQLPKFPLTSWAGGFTVKLDGFAFLIGVIAGGFLLSRMLKIKRLNTLPISNDVVFSLAYLGGITLSVFLFRGGSLFSLNRFVFATPFIISVVNYWLTLGFTLRHKQVALIFGLILSFWLLFGSFVHIQTMLKFSLLSLYVILLFAMKSESPIFRKVSLPLLIILNFGFQVLLYVRFLTGEWVG